jgi:hypothetical protein
MDPTTIAAGVGLIGSLFGGGQQQPGYVKQNYGYINGILQRGLGLYDNTDLNAQDNQTVNDYSTGAMHTAMAMLGNYNAQAAGNGSGAWKADTMKDRAMSQIAGDQASRVADLRAQLDSTRPERKAALLPSAMQAAMGGQDAMYLDGQQRAQQGAQTQGILSAAQLVGGLFGRRSAAPSPMFNMGPQNDRGYMGAGGSGSYNVGYQSPMNPPWMNQTFPTGYTGMPSSSKGSF